ncbi:carbon-monoxide dehydrogenase medium subunit [Streptomyces chrestomyceticus JCM 4735]|uniref:Carbon-monoxide dehydrogenase medium subunit n=1 Tax=Streptomyces chrestomyceticus JCM 4735 TaxID=1306181 RepID=A0A7U9KP80_9ACTN|nr:FAD binding domain-containing protein [Streptomyces chrestomyceticus]GCD32839.1 carbon-monoxide dehydrogenase medium subunit [Streptomyces chrestomyceticus JCM 4735]
MHAAPFAFHAARDLKDALEVLAMSPGAAVLAGGLSLIPELRSRRRRAALLVDINNVPGLDGVTALAGRPGGPRPVLRIGCTARQADVLAVAARHPGHALLAAALRTMGTALVRQRGTLAGAVAQAAPELQMSALCSVLDIRVTVRRAADTHDRAARELYAEAGPGPGELVAAVEVPGCRSGEGWAFLRAGRRTFGAHLGGVAVRLDLHPDGRCRGARIAPFVAGHDGTALAEAGASLCSGPVDTQAVRRAADLAARTVRTRSDALASADYRRHLVRVLVRRALVQAVDRTRGPFGEVVS